MDDPVRSVVKGRPGSEEVPDQEESVACLRDVVSSLCTHMLRNAGIGHRDIHEGLLAHVGLLLGHRGILGADLSEVRLEAHVCGLAKQLDPLRAALGLRQHGARAGQISEIDLRSQSELGTTRFQQNNAPSSVQLNTTYKNAECSH